MTNDLPITSAHETGFTRGVRYVLVAVFLLSGILKLVGADSARSMFEEFGYSQDFRVLIGALETAGAIGLLIRPLILPASLGLCAIMIGALFTHVENDPWYMAIGPSIVLLALFAVAWQQPVLVTWRRRRSRAGETPVRQSEHHARAH